LSTKVVTLLRAWVDSGDVHGELVPPWRVFRQDIDGALLESLCRNGPADRRDITGDIKLIWDYGRAHAFALNALREKGNRRAAAVAIGGGVKRWLDANEDRAGAAWISPMDVAIRAVNWIVADAALDGGVSDAFGAELWRDLLWEHGCRVEYGLDVRLLTTNNHYLAELLGLAWIGVLFGDTSRGQHWSRFARVEMSAALLAQTYPDGGLHEASLPYHVFVTEMALLFLAIQDQPMPARWVHRLRQMVDITANAGNERGEVFQVGDSDGGRIVPIEFISRSLGYAAVVTRLAAQLGLSSERTRMSQYPDSGWAVLRDGPIECHIEFGGWGPFGIAGHAHNDLLSVCVNWNGQSLIVDPGSYLYTPDLVARNHYRATAAHNTIQFDEREQTPLPSPDPEHVFVFRGPRSPCRVISAGTHRIEVENCEAAAAGTSIRHARAVELSGDGLRISDTVIVPSSTRCAWSFHLAPGVSVDISRDPMILSGLGVRVGLTGPTPAMEVTVEDTEVSPFYGIRVPTRCLRFSAVVNGRCDVVFLFRSA